MQNRFEGYKTTLREILPIGRSFDVVERKIKIGGKEASMFFVEGLTNADKMQRLMSFLLNIGLNIGGMAGGKITGNTAVNGAGCGAGFLQSGSTEDFIQRNMPYLSCDTQTDINLAVKSVFTGLVALIIDGFDKIIIIDEREYPMRAVSEPEKEKTLRGAKDGFTEGLMTNIALIRRRIRDRRLIFASHTAGDVTKTDMALVYMEGVADAALVKSMTDKIQALKINTITVGEQTLVEMLSELDGNKKRKMNKLNPFPKVRYTQRPDIVSAHLTEGKIAILVDNSPTVILLPTGIFDFMQDVDDYYFPAITGNYFRLLRVMNFFIILFITPVYILIVEKYIPVFQFMEFIVPDEGYAIPLFWQFIILEIAIDALKLASLNTPNSLGLSLSVVGALILGEFAVQAGWFIPQTILCMAVVALASFTQPSMELQYGVKFMRLIMLIGAGAFGIYGACAGLAAGLLVMGTTKTLIGTSYLYPLIPFNKTAIKRLLFRTGAGAEK